MADSPEPTGSLQGSAATQWKPGESGNPAGRPKGSRNKLGEKFIEDLHDDWLEHGKDAIVAARTTKPEQYVKVVASLLPRDVNLNVNPLSELTNEQLIERIRAYHAVVAPLLTPGTGSTDGGTRPETTH